MLRHAAPWLATAVPWLALGGAAVAVAALAIRLGAYGGQAAGAVQPFATAGLRMDIPAHWTINKTGWPSFGMGSTWAIVGTTPWGECKASDLNCHYEQRLAPGQIEVEVGMVGRLVDFCETGATRSDLAGRGLDEPIATGRLMRVAGRPTIQTDYAVGRRDYYGSDEWRIWRIAGLGTTTQAYTISAKYQGPEVALFRAQLDAMVASLRISDPPRVADPVADCGPPFPP